MDTRSNSSRWTPNKSEHTAEPPYVPIGPYKRKRATRGGRKAQADRGVMCSFLVPRVVFKAIKRFSREQDVNISAWMRAMVMADLLKRGYLTVEDMKGQAA